MLLAWFFSKMLAVPLNEVYNAAKVEKEKLIVPGAGHGEAEKIDSEKYWNTVWGFVEKYIPA